MAWENFKQFEALKQTTKNSLDWIEKAQLNKVSERDYRKALSTIEGQQFKIDGLKIEGRDPTLKQIVEKLTFSADWKTAYLNWKAIEASSELWAALQVLVIANDYSVWSCKIDGTVWKDTISGLQNLKTKYLAEVSQTPQQPTTPERRESKEKFPERNAVELVNHWYYENLIGIYSQKKYNILNDEGYIKNRIKKTDIEMRGQQELVPITYKSAVTKETITLKIDAKVAYEDEAYSPTKFWKEIEKQIKAKEDALQKKEDERLSKEKLDADNKVIADGINKYSRNSFKDKVVLKYVKDKSIDFKEAKVGSDGKVKFDDSNKDGNKTWTISECRKKLLNKDGTFNSQKFEAMMTNQYENNALTYVEWELLKSEKGLVMVINDEADAVTYIKKCEALITEINWYNRKEYNEIKDRVLLSKQNAEKKKQNFETQKKNNEAYKEASKEMNNDLSTIESYGNSGKVTNIAPALNLMKKYIALTEVPWSYGNAYKKWQYTNVCKKYEAVAKRAEYVSNVNNMEENLKKLRIYFE